MKHLKHFKVFESDSKSKYSVGDKVRTKSNIDHLLDTHPQFRVNDNTGIDQYLGKDCEITKAYYDNRGFYRYYIDIDNGDYWWVDECFEDNNISERDSSYTLTKKQYDYLLPIFGNTTGTKKLLHTVDRKHDKYFFIGSDEEYKDALNRCKYLK